MILVGSRALAMRASTLLGRKPKDFDFIAHEVEETAWLTSYPEAKPHPLASGKTAYKIDETMVEFEHFDRPSNQMLSELVEADHMSTSFGMVPSVDLLFTIKQSHRYLKNSPHFWKNFGDWHRLRAAGAKVRPEYQEFLKVREKETYNYKHPSLNQSKKSFFSDDNIKYQYDHDSIHRAVARMDAPAYTFFQKDGSEVACDRSKFEACPRAIQLNSVVEESAVLAIERSLVPHAGKLTPRDAWLFAFSKVCTSISSGYWRQFAYENGLDVLRLYPEDYYDCFLRGLGSGVVKEAQ